MRNFTNNRHSLRRNLNEEDKMERDIFSGNYIDNLVYDDDLDIHYTPIPDRDDEKVPSRVVYSNNKFRKLPTPDQFYYLLTQDLILFSDPSEEDRAFEFMSSVTDEDEKKRYIYYLARNGGFRLRRNAWQVAESRKKKEKALQLTENKLNRIIKEALKEEINKLLK